MHLRLASYNVQKAVGTDLRRDPARVLSVMAALEADILALQEADKRRHPRPSPFDPEAITGATGLTALPIGGTGVSLGHHGNAVLVRDGITALETRQLELPGLEPRGGVMARLEVDGHDLTVIGTHLGLLRRDRQRQCRYLLEALGDTPRAAILGDFNEWRPIGGLAPLAAGMTIVRPGRSFHAARPLAAFDRAALRGMTPLTSGVFTSRTARRASDHLPVWVDVKITG